MPNRTGPASRLTPGPAAGGFGEWLQRWLAALDRSSDEIAAEVGVSPLTAYRWHRGLNRPKSKDLRERVVRLLQGWGATDVPTDFRQKGALPLDDPTSSKFLLVALSNPVLEREAAKIALQKLLRGKAEVRYLLLRPDLHDLELSLFPMLREVLLETGRDELKTGGDECARKRLRVLRKRLRVFLWRPLAGQGADGVDELMSLLLGKQVLTASLTEGREPNAALMRRDTTLLDRHLPKVTETPVELTKASFDALFEIIDSAAAGVKVDLGDMEKNPKEHAEKLMAEVKKLMDNAKARRQEGN